MTKSLLLVVVLGAAVPSSGQVLPVRDQSPNELTFAEVESAIGPLIHEARGSRDYEIRMMPRPYGAVGGDMVRFLGPRLRAESFNWVSPRNGNVHAPDFPPVGGACSGADYVCATRVSLRNFVVPRQEIEAVIAGQHPCPEVTTDVITVSSHEPRLWIKVYGAREYREYNCDLRPGTVAARLYSAIVAPSR